MPRTDKITDKYRLMIVLSLIVIVPLGFYTKIYSGPGEAWIRNSFGGLVYEMFWCLLGGLVWPGAKPLRIAFGVLFFTCCLEFLQLWDPPVLHLLRSNFIGRTILGVSFNWLDFPYYIIGSMAGYVLLVVMRNISGFNPHTSDPPAP